MKEARIKKYLLPLVLMLAVSGCGLQKDNNASQIGQNTELTGKAAENKADLTLIVASDHVRGDTAAPVKLIEYCDFTDEFCLKLKDDAELLAREFTDKIAIVFRNYPSESIVSVAASAASECAAEQGRFWEMHDALFSDLKDNKLNREEIDSNATELGLDQEKYNSCMKSAETSNKIADIQKQARSADLIGVPTLYVNRQIVAGARSLDDYINTQGEKVLGLRSLVKRALEGE